MFLKYKDIIICLNCKGCNSYLNKIVSTNSQVEWMTIWFWTFQGTQIIMIKQFFINIIIVQIKNLPSEQLEEENMLYSVPKIITHCKSHRKVIIMEPKFIPVNQTKNRISFGNLFRVLIKSSMAEMLILSDLSVERHWMYVMLKQNKDSQLFSGTIMEAKIKFGSFNPSFDNTIKLIIFINYCNLLLLSDHYHLFIY